MTNEALLARINLFARIYAKSYTEKALALYSSSDKTMIEAEIEFEKIKEEFRRRENYLYSWATPQINAREKAESAAEEKVFYISKDEDPVGPH